MITEAILSSVLKRLPCSEWEYGHIWYLWHRRRLKIRCWCINYDCMCAFLWLGSLAFPKLTRFRPGRAATSACLNKNTVFISDLISCRYSFLCSSLFHCFPFGLRKEKPSTSLRSKPRHKCPFHSHFPSREHTKSIQILFNAGRIKQNVEYWSLHVNEGDRTRDQIQHRL